MGCSVRCRCSAWIMLVVTGQGDGIGDFALSLEVGGDEGWDSMSVLPHSYQSSFVCLRDVGMTSVSGLSAHTCALPLND